MYCNIMSMAVVFNRFCDKHCRIIVLQDIKCSLQQHIKKDPKFKISSQYSSHCTVRLATGPTVDVPIIPKRIKYCTCESCLTGSVSMRMRIWKSSLPMYVSLYKRLHDRAESWVDLVLGACFLRPTDTIKVIWRLSEAEDWSSQNFWEFKFWSGNLIKKRIKEE